MNLLSLTALTLVLVTIAPPASAQAPERVSAVLEAIKAARGTRSLDRVWIDLAYDEALAQTVGRVPDHRMRKVADALVCEGATPSAQRCTIVDGDLVIAVRSVDVAGDRASAVVDNIWISKGGREPSVAYVRRRYTLARSPQGWTVADRRVLHQS